MPRINGVPVSPRARRQLASNPLALGTVRGSGPNGRIVVSDLENAPATGAHRVSPMRHAIAQRTTEGFAVPHFYLRAEADATELLRFREARADSEQRPARERLTITDVVLKAMGTALRDLPFANAVWRDGAIEKLTSADVGLVVALDDGLLIPIVRRTDALTLEEIARQRTDLADAARSGRLSAEQTRGAAASLSNLGRVRVDEFSAILATGQTLMLAMGRIAPRPFVHKGELRVRSTVKLTLSVDHRVLDGEPAARFLEALIGFLEQPENLFQDRG